VVKSDSLLNTEQVTGQYQAKDPQLAVYLRYVTLLKDAFAEFELVHVPREQNFRADLLAKLGSLGKGNRQRPVIQETLKNPKTVEEEPIREVLLINTREGRSLGNVKGTTGRSMRGARGGGGDCLLGENF